MSDFSSDVCEFRVFVRRLATPSLTLSPKDSAAVERLASCLDATLQRRWHILLKNAVDEELPLLYCYASDGWGTKLSEGHSYSIGPHIIRREGRVYTEFLLQRAVLKSIEADSAINMAMSIVAPIGMGEGKSGWHIWQAACNFTELLRFSAAHNIVMSVYMQDGLRCLGA